MQFLIIMDVKKLVSPLRSTVTFRKSSSRMGQMALVGYCVHERQWHSGWWVVAVGRVGRRTVM